MTPRPAFELADVFRRHGESYERANAGHLGRVERRVIGATADAIEIETESGARLRFYRRAR